MSAAIALAAGFIAFSSPVLAGPVATSILSISSSEWHNLNQSTNGRVHFGVPVAQPCFARYTNGQGVPDTARADLSACREFLGHRTNSSWLATQFGGYDNTQSNLCMATNKGCNIDAHTPLPLAPLVATCKQGSVPDVYIDAHGVSDVQAGLKFAAAHKLNLVVKNSGHDYKGRSSGSNALAIWHVWHLTHNIRPDVQIVENFQPEKCKSGAGPAAVFGAGQGFAGIYEKAHEHGYMVVGGTSASVGASGGWLLGGGHSALSPTYGLGVDNTLQMKVVLPNGTFITANRCQNTDIFYALRGGGGNAFGVVIETVTKAHPEMAFTAGISLGIDSADKIRDIYIENTPQWSKDGWGGYGAAIGPILFVLLVTPKLSLEEAQESMAPLNNFVKSLGNVSVPLTMTIKTVANYWEYFNTPIAQALGQLNGETTVMASRLISQSLFEGKQNKQILSDAMKDVSENFFGKSMAPAGLLFVPPSQYELPESDKPGGPGEASITPAWRNAYWHSLFQLTAQANTNDLAKKLKTVSDSATPFRKITPGGGAYQNEGDTYEPDYTNSFWSPEGYRRLSAIKKEIDPDNLLTCHQCIGYDATDPRWGCYPEVNGAR